MPTRSVFEYAVIRVVPLVERGEFINAGVVLMCRSRRFLDARIELDTARLASLAPGVDVDAIAEQLDYVARACRGGAGAGPIGELPLYERFRWVTAPRSTIVQPSPVHSGLCDDPRTTLERLLTTLVRQPERVLEAGLR
ncbi:MAG TPA: DUF3037 domain-containing protein [Herpetosiphonaceae bacterium]|jgi:hypothetical protein|nr:DUF3037 domain-containing protein [Herpetosiphonaceae bacterium]